MTSLTDKVDEPWKTENCQIAAFSRIFSSQDCYTKFSRQIEVMKCQIAATAAFSRIFSSQDCSTNFFRQIGQIELMNWQIAKTAAFSRIFSSNPQFSRTNPASDQRRFSDLLEKIDEKICELLFLSSSRGKPVENCCQFHIFCCCTIQRLLK